MNLKKNKKVGICGMYIGEWICVEGKVEEDLLWEAYVAMLGNELMTFLPLKKEMKRFMLLQVNPKRFRYKIILNWA